MSAGSWPPLSTGFRGGSFCQFDAAILPPSVYLGQVTQAFSALKYQTCGGENWEQLVYGDEGMACLGVEAVVETATNRAHRTVADFFILPP